MSRSSSTQNMVPLTDALPLPDYSLGVNACPAIPWLARKRPGLPAVAPAFPRLEVEAKGKLHLAVCPQAHGLGNGAVQYAEGASRNPRCERLSRLECAPDRTWKRYWRI